MGNRCWRNVQSWYVLAFNLFSVLQIDNHRVSRLISLELRRFGSWFMRNLQLFISSKESYVSADADVS